MPDTSFREYTLRDLVTRADDEWYDRDVCYEFSTGRRFEDDDATAEGIYDGS